MNRILLLFPLIFLYGCDDQPRKIAINELRFERPAPVVKIEAEAAADAAFNDQVPATNVTAQFRERFHQYDQYIKDAHLERLRDCNVLIVHGLLGEIGLKVQSMLDTFDHDERVIDYLKDQRKAIDELGLQAHVAGFKSASVERSSGKIVEAILKSDKPVIILSHSKGCVDTLDALLKLSSQGKLDRVAGWIAIQGVFYGSPDADSYVKNRFKNAYAHVALKFMCADFDSIRDLTTKRREQYQAEHAAEIESLTQKLPVLCFASWEHKEADKKHGDDPPAPLCDGQVPTHSAILPGSEFVAKANVSHSMTVIHSSKPYDRVKFTKTLLLMLSEQMEKMAAK